MSEEIKEVSKEAVEVKPKGFSLLIDGEGAISLTPHNLQSDWELAGMIDYASSKKEELMKNLGRSPEFRTLQAVKGLTDVLSKVFAKEESEPAKVAESLTES